MLDVVNGVPRVRLWPKKRGKSKTPEQIERTEFFRHASWAAKYLEPSITAEIMAGREGTAFLPRDIAFMMFAGTLAYIVTPNGKVTYPVQARQKVSESLDALSQTPGAFLRRGTQFWEAIENVAALPWYWSPPDPATWTLLSGSGPDLTATYDSIKGTSVRLGTPGTGDFTRAAVRPLPSPSGDWSLDFRADFFLPPNDYSGCGVILRDSVGGRLVSFTTRGNVSLAVDYWNSLSGFNSEPYGFNPPVRAYFPFWRIRKTGSDLEWMLSPDGVSYVQIWTASATAFLANPPDQIGFGGQYNRNVGLENLFNVQQWVLT